MNSLILAIVLFVSAAAPPGPSDVPADARRAIQAANDAWIPAMKRQDAAAVAEPYADDGVFVGTDGRTVIGRAGVSGLMRERFAAARVVAGTLTHDGMRMEGALVYEWGHANVQLQSQAARMVSRGRYLTVWKRDASGRWRIWRNLSLPD